MVRKDPSQSFSTEHTTSTRTGNSMSPSAAQVSQHASGKSRGRGASRHPPCHPGCAAISVEKEGPDAEREASWRRRYFSLSPPLSSSLSFYDPSPPPLCVYLILSVSLCCSCCPAQSFTCFSSAPPSYLFLHLPVPVVLYSISLSSSSLQSIYLSLSALLQFPVRLLFQVSHFLASCLTRLFYLPTAFVPLSSSLFSICPAAFGHRAS